MTNNMSYNLDELASVLLAAAHLSDLKLDKNSVELVRKGKKESDQQSIDSIRSIFQRAAKDSVTDLNNPEGPTKDHTFWNLDKESNLIVLQSSKVNFICKLVNSSLAKEIFSTKEEIDLLKTEAAKQTEILNQTIALSLDHLQHYVDHDLPSDLTRLKYEDFSKTARNFQNYPLTSIVAAKSRNAIQTFHRKIGEQTLKQLFQKECPELTNRIGQLTPEDQQILYEMQGRGELLKPTANRQEIQPKIDAFLLILNQLNAIKNETLKPELKKWLFLNNNKWEELDWTPLLEFTDTCGIEATKEIFSETLLYSSIYEASSVRLWIVCLINNEIPFSKEESLKSIRESLLLVRDQCSKQEFIHDPISSAHPKAQLQLIDRDVYVFRDLSLLSARENILGVANVHPTFPILFFEINRKLGDIFTQLSFSSTFKQLSQKNAVELAPLFQKLAKEDSKILISSVQFMITAIEKCPVSFKRQLPSILLNLPEKKDFLEALFKALPLDPEALKAFFEKNGESVLYQRVFESTLQTWINLKNITTIHQQHANSFYRWMGQQLLTPPKHLEALSSEQWLELSKTFTPDFIVLIREFVNTLQALPDHSDNLFALFEHNPSKESLLIICDHIRFLSPKTSQLIPFLLSHPELIPNIPTELAAKEFDRTYLRMPLPIISFIFKNSLDSNKFKDLLVVQAKSPEKLAKIIELESKYPRSLLWPPDSFQTEVYSSIDIKHVEAVLKSPKWQDYLRQKDRTIFWHRIPVKIYDTAPELPLVLFEILNKYKSITESISPVLSAVVNQATQAHLAFRLEDLNKRCLENKTKMKSELPLNTLSSLLTISRCSDDTLALELFDLIITQKETTQNLSFLTISPWKELLPPLIEAISTSYSSLKNLTTVTEKLQQLPKEWKYAIIELIKTCIESPKNREKDIAEVTQQPFLAQVEKVLNKYKTSAESLKSFNDLYFFPEDILKDQKLLERLSKCGSRYFNKEAYSAEPKMYLDWFMKFPYHPGLNLLFAKGNNQTRELLKTIDLNLLSNPDRFYDHVLFLAQLNEQEALHTLISNLVKTKNYSRTEQLLDMAKAGYIPEAIEIISLQPKESDNTLIQKLLISANSKTADMIKPILEVFRSNWDPAHPLAKALAQDPSTPGFSALQKSLVVLKKDNQTEHVQRLLDLLNKPPQQYTEQEKKIVHCYSIQAFDLANLFATPLSKSWELLNQLPFDSTLIVPMAHLLKDCQAAGKESAWESILTLIHSKQSVDTIKTKIGTLQYVLVHRPELLNIDPYKWNVDPLVPIRTSIEKLNEQTFPDPKNKAAALETALSLEIAKALTTANGQINHALISAFREAIRNNPVFSKESDAGIYLETTLRSLETSPEASQLLSQITFPANQTSPSVLIVRKMLGLKDVEPLTAWHCQVAVLSALLYRTRQGNVGSCYGTQQAIIMQSDTNNLLQSIRDYRELIMENSLKKIQKGKTEGLYTYSLVVSQLRLKEPIPLVNLLVKEREILLSNMSGASSQGILTQSLSLFEKDNAYDSALNRFNYHFIGINPPVQTEVILNALREEFQKKTKAVVQFDIPDPITNKLGYWSLERRDKVETICNAQSYLNLQNELIEATFGQLSERHPAHKEYLQTIQESLLQFVRTKLVETFETKFWSRSAGGFAEQVSATYLQYEENIPLLNIPADEPENLLKILTNYLQALPQKEQVSIEQEPERLLSLVIPSHGLCWKPHDLNNKLRLGLTSDEIVEQMKTPPSLTMASLSEPEQQELLKKWSQALPSALVEPFTTAIANLDWKKMSVEEFGQHLLKTTKTVNGGELPSKLLLALHQAFYGALPKEIHNRLPFLILADLNWNDSTNYTNYNNFYLGLSRSPLTGQLDYIFTKRNGQRKLPHWNIRGDWKLHQQISRVHNQRITYKK